jgi:hypothetical protein
MTDIEERFAGNGDDGSLIERQLLSRANVQRKLCVRPAKNRLAYPTPLRFAGISQTMIPGLSPVASAKPNADRHPPRLSQHQQGP